MVFINQYCIIRNRSIEWNGASFFKSSAKSLDTFLDEAYDHLKIGYPKFYKMDLQAKLGLIGSEVLLRATPLKEVYQPEDVALIIANASSSTDTDEAYLTSVESVASPSLFVYTLPNITAGEICIRQKIKGENTFFVMPAFDSEVLGEYTQNILEEGLAKACITGWVDVLDEEHELFFYLAEPTKNENSILHTAENIQKIYH